MQFACRQKAKMPKIMFLKIPVYVWTRPKQTCVPTEQEITSFKLVKK